MTTLFKIADGIINQDDDDRRITLSGDIETMNYAEAAGRDIDFAEAEKVRLVVRDWLDNIEHGNGDWGRYRDQARDALDSYEDRRDDNDPALNTA